MTSTKGLEASAFSRLLGRLDDDLERAGEKHEDLRRVLIRFFEWRGAFYPEELTDETLNRVARKLGDGIEIKNLNAYCHEVGRFVFLESLRAPDAGRVNFDAVAYEIHASDGGEAQSEHESRLACLDDCLAALSTGNRRLILDYYNDDSRDRIGHRRSLAERLGLRRDALANRAQRLRDKLETCVNRCLRKKSLI